MCISILHDLFSVPYFEPLLHSQPKQKPNIKRKEESNYQFNFCNCCAQRGRLVFYDIFFSVVLVVADFSRLYSATGYAIEPRLKQIQDEDAGHIFREPTSASSISDSVNRVNKSQYNYRDEVNLKWFCNFH